MDEESKQAIVNATGFSVGTLPMRYLGLPLTSKKWSKMECHQLVEKITGNIQTGYAKLLSYAGRLQVINSVLFAMYNFWGAVFILPQSVIKAIDRKCREYLWGTVEGHRKMALVSWEVVCRPRLYGGLNIKGCKNWNIASVGKLLWQIVTNKEVLWVRWVHGIYMKTCSNIWEHRAPSDCSWYWKKLNSLKQNMAQWYQGNAYRLNSIGQYSVSRSYNAMLGYLPRCREMKLIWSRMLIPRHRFVLWLAYQQKLQTKGRLLQLNIPIADNAECCLCEQGVIESQQHLLGDCSWFKEMKEALTSWAGINLPNMAIPELLKWINRRHWKYMKKEVATAVIGAMVYHSWQVRNWRIFRQIDLKLDFCTGQIKKELRDRISMYEESKRARQCPLMMQRLRD